MQELSFHCKHFSQSIKRLLPHLAASNPESPSKPTTLKLSSPKSPRKRIRRLNLREGESYEKMVDDVMRRHAQEQQIPLQMTKLLVRHNYKNYRIINSDLKPPQRKSNRDHNEERISDLQHSDRNVMIRKHHTEETQLKTEIIHELLDRRRKTKNSALELPSILKYDRGLTLELPIISNKSILTNKSSPCTQQEPQDMRVRFIKKYVKSYTQA